MSLRLLAEGQPSLPWPTESAFSVGVTYGMDLYGVNSSFHLLLPLVPYSRIYSLSHLRERVFLGTRIWVYSLKCFPAVRQFFLVITKWTVNDPLRKPSTISCQYWGLYWLTARQNDEFLRTKTFSSPLDPSGVIHLFFEVVWFRFLQ